MIPNEKTDLKKANSAHDTGVQSVEDAIIDVVVKKMDTNEPLPTEKQMVERFGISRTSLREIFSALEANGMIRSYQGRGRYAVMPDIGSQIVNSWAVVLRAKPEMILEFLEIRHLLEIHSLENAMHRTDLESLQKMGAQVEQMKKRAQCGKTFAKEDREFHRVIFASTHNTLLEQLLTAFWDVYDRLGIENGSDSNLIEVARQHEDIYRCFVKQDLAGATHLMEEQFVDARCQIVAFLSAHKEERRAASPVPIEDGTGAVYVSAAQPE